MKNKNRRQQSVDNSSAEMVLSRQREFIIGEPTTDDIIKIYPLSQEEKIFCAEIFKRGGPEYLRFELSWNATQVKEFMAKKAVRAELDYLRRTYLKREAIQERAQFFSQLRINQMVPAAIGVVAKALRGDKQTDDGNVDRAPSRGQFDAALDVLDRANIHGDKFKGEDVPSLIDARSVSIALGETASESDPVALTDRESRDMVRTFMDRALNRLKTNESGKSGKKSKGQKAD